MISSPASACLSVIELAVLSVLPARDLLRRLRKYLAENDDLSENEVAMIQELVRRARQTEAAQLKAFVEMSPYPCRTCSKCDHRWLRLTKGSFESVTGRSQIV
jgi:hypothetical protein